MRTKVKTFDCVAFKTLAQRRLMKEFEARRGEFATYADFINTVAEENPKVRALREALGLARQAGS